MNSCCQRDPHLAPCLSARARVDDVGSGITSDGPIDAIAPPRHLACAREWERLVAPHPVASTVEAVAADKAGDDRLASMSGSLVIALSSRPFFAHPNPIGCAIITAKARVAISRYAVRVDSLRGSWAGMDPGAIVGYAGGWNTLSSFGCHRSSRVPRGVCFAGLLASLSGAPPALCIVWRFGVGPVCA